MFWCLKCHYQSMNLGHWTKFSLILLILKAQEWKNWLFQDCSGLNRFQTFLIFVFFEGNSQVCHKISDWLIRSIYRYLRNTSLFLFLLKSSNQTVLLFSESLNAWLSGQCPCRTTVIRHKSFRLYSSVLKLREYLTLIQEKCNFL